MKRALFPVATAACALGAVIFGIGNFALASPWREAGMVLGATLAIGGTVYVLWAGEA